MVQILGIDEVGRGALAGPVVVGAVCGSEQHVAECVASILELLKLPALRDSKKLKPQQRELISEYVQAHICWAIGSAEPQYIDEHGLVAALTYAAGQAIEGIHAQTAAEITIMADAGLHHPFEDIIPTQWLIKGDETVPEIGLASSLAKVYRNAVMKKYESEYPGYGFAQHVGYGTKLHYRAIKELGVTPLHRKLFLRSLADK